MFQLRKVHTEAFDKGAWENFQEEMFHHLHAFSPQQCKLIGKAGVRGIVQSGCEKGRNYGFSTVGGLRLYLELMFLFGSEFDTDPQYFWAGEILKTRSPDEMAWAELLHQTAQECLQVIGGHKNQFLIAAARRWYDVKLDDFETETASSEAALIERLRLWYPEKFNHVGESRYRGLVQRMRPLTHQHQLESHAGAALFLALTVALGHGFLADGLVPWVQNVLRETQRKAVPERQEQLNQRFRAFLHPLLGGS